MAIVGLAAGPLAILAAFDLHDQVPSLSPQSVEFLLREAVREAIGADLAITGEQLLGGMCEAGSSLNLGDLDLLGAPLDNTTGRICLASFIHEVLAGRAAATDMDSRVGLSATRSLPLEEWTAWIFRDLQAVQLSASK